MIEKIKTCIKSEFGNLEAVIIHKPGSEIENMTPLYAERALYSDILNLSIASVEYEQLYGVLKKVTLPFEVRKLLAEVLKIEENKKNLVTTICKNEGIPEAVDFLLVQEPEKLSALLMEGVLLKKNNLTRYLSEERFLMRPLHNLFFTRDAAMGMNELMLIGSMANQGRERETILFDAILRQHPMFETEILNPASTGQNPVQAGKITIEGGDFMMAREDILIIGTGTRTSTQGIDFVIDFIRKTTKSLIHIIVQELPPAPESFIHLDMVFTLIDQETCLIYPPVILEPNRYRTIQIRIEGGKVTRIGEMQNIPAALRKLGMDLQTVFCGGKTDLWVQEREQWHSGANFLAFSPGRIIGYKRNIYTLEELHRIGFEIIEADKVINGKISPAEYKKCVVTIAGSELARGGGGARCMTMPVRRSQVVW